MSTLAGYTDPATLCDVFAYNVNDEILNVATGLYVAWVDGTSAVNFRVPVVQAGNNGARTFVIPTDCVRWELRERQATLVASTLLGYGEETVTSADIDALAELIFAAGPASGVPIVVVGDSLSAQTSTRFKTILSSTVVFTGYTALALTIKRDAKRDEDEDALVVIRISNPAVGGTDGIKIFNGRMVDNADAMRLKYTMVPAADNQITITIDADAMQIPPSPESAPWDYEIDYWDAGGKKIQWAQGKIGVGRSGRRATSIP